MIEEIKIDRLEELIHEMMIKIRDTYPTNSAEGNPIDIENAAAAPLVKCVTAITGYQSGSGTPSSENIRPIVGYNQSTILVENENELPNAEAATKTSNGITVVSDGKGRFTISGTATADTDIVFELSKNYIVPVSVDEGGSGCMHLLNNFVSTGVYVLIIHNSTVLDYWSCKEANRLLPSYVQMAGETMNKIGIRVSNGTTVDGNMSPMFTNNGTVTNIPFKEYATKAYTTTFTSPIYKGSEDVVTGKVTAEWGYIAEYDGETLPGLWISDRDEYNPESTPTIGAQVAYELESPTTITETVSNAPISSLHEYNHIKSSTGDVELTYITEEFEALANVPAES